MGNDAVAKKQTILEKVFDKNPILEYTHGLFVRKYEPDEKYHVGDPRFSYMAVLNRLDPNFPGYKHHAMDNSMGFLGSAPGILAGLTDDLNMGLADTSNHACTKIEASALGCLEYYGFSRGRDICKDHYDDFMECVFRKKQLLRARVMWEERQKRYREYLAGKRDWESVYIPAAPIGVHIDPAPNPKNSFVYNTI